jgi:IS5 family transposase
MSIIPDFVLSLVIVHLTPLLHWFSERVYADLLKRTPDHLLVKLAKRLDLTPMETACATFHHAEGPGTKPTHSVPHMVRALLVGYLYDWSLRELEWQIRYNLVVKWFVGYPVFADGPDHTTLDRFELWVCFEQHRTIFDHVLDQIDAEFPHERRQAQIGDTYALRANAAKESLVRLIRHTCQCLLTTLAQADPAREAQVKCHLDLTALFGKKGELGEHHLTPEERAARLQATALAALTCACQVRVQLEHPLPLSPEARVPVQQWLERLDKLIADEVQLSRDNTGQMTQVTERAPDDKGGYRLGSATDPDATYRVHGDDKKDFGYNVSLVVTDNFVREVQADTGAQPDPVAIPDLLTAQRDHHDLVPDKFIYDAAAGAGKTRAQVAQATEGHTQLVSPLTLYEKPTDLFTPERFQLSNDGLVLTCPHGQTTSVAYRSGSGEGRVFRFFGFQCRDCPLWAQCRSQKPGSKAMRQVFISDYRPYLEAARAYNQTDAFKADMKRRPKVERIIAALVRYNGARRARRRGQVKADFQAKMNATAYNLKRWLRLSPSVAQPA